MKIFILVSMLIASSATFASSCENFDGKWLIQGGDPSDGLDILNIAQKDCDTIKFSWMIFSLDGKENSQPKMPSYPYLFAGKIVANSIELYERKESYRNCGPFQYWILQKLNNETLLETKIFKECDGSQTFEEQNTYHLTRF